MPGQTVGIRGHELIRTIDQEFEVFVEELVEEVVAEAARIREHRERGEPEGRDAPLGDKPWRDLVALAVSYGSPEHIPQDINEAVEATIAPPQGVKGHSWAVEELEAKFSRYLVVEALERGLPPREADRPL